MGDSIEIDLTEIYALEVLLNGLYACANFTVAYNVDFYGMDSVEAIATFSKGGSFLKMRDNGKSMNNVKSGLISGAVKLQQGIEFLRNETDVQDNDVIKIDPGMEEELDQILAEIDEFMDFFSQDQVFNEDWDDDETTLEEDMTINFGKLFDNPINDLKAKLPDYSVDVAAEDFSLGSDWYNGHIPMNTIITTQTADEYPYYSRSFYWYGGEDTYDYFYNNISIPRFDEVFDSLKTELMSNPKITYFSLYTYWSGYYATAGDYQVYAELYYDYEIERSLMTIYAPVLTWSANSFSEWIFPDPTFNGFLPGMTDAEFKRIFGIQSADWEKTP
jgi:hypothetical protein